MWSQWNGFQGLSWDHDIISEQEGNCTLSEDEPWNKRACPRVMLCQEHNHPAVSLDSNLGWQVNWLALLSPWINFFLHVDFEHLRTKVISEIITLTCWASILSLEIHHKCNILHKEEWELSRCGRGLAFSHRKLLFLYSNFHP